MRVLGPCPCAGQTSRVRATASGPGPCKFRSCAYTSICSLEQVTVLLQAETWFGGRPRAKWFEWSVPFEMSLLGSFRNGGIFGPVRRLKGWWPGSCWGWGECGVLTRPRSISPAPKMTTMCHLISMTPCVISPFGPDWTRSVKSSLLP